MENKEKDQKRKKNGRLGEEIGCRFLMKHSFTILTRNFRQKCGEIDIVARKSGRLHFFEVKTVSRENKSHVIHETNYRAEDNMHQLKINKIQRTVQLYLLKNNVSYETPFQIDGITVILNHTKRTAKVRLVENINVF